MNKVAIWGQALRPKTLPASVGPVLLGQALVSPGHFALLTAMLCLLCALSLQLAVNLANDLFDGLAEVDQPDRLGPTRALQAGWLSVGELRAGLVVTLGMAMVTGLWLIRFGHWLLWVLGGLAVVGVLGYSGGRRPYANLGLGEAAVWCFFGPVAVLGSLLAQQSPITLPAVAAGILVGMPVAAILVVNNQRDRHTDARAGKATLAVRMGPGATRWLYALLSAGPLVASLPLGLANWAWALWSLLGLMVAGLMREFWRRDGAALNGLLGLTALYSLGVALWLGLRLTVAGP